MNVFILVSIQCEIDLLFLNQIKKLTPLNYMHFFNSKNLNIFIQKIN